MGFWTRGLDHFHQRSGFDRPERQASPRERGLSRRTIARTKTVWAKLQPYFADERKKGVLAVDTQTPSTLLAHKAGYIDRENEFIVGLQTDQRH